MKKVIIIILITFLNCYVFSQFISESEAYQKAVEYFEFKTNDTLYIPTKSYNVNSIIENDTIFLYLVDIEEIGWALVSGFGTAGPYFAYSDHSTVDLTDMPPAAEMWFDYYKNIVRHCIHNPQDSSFYQEELISKINQKSTSEGSFYMIQTEWNQGPPFNNYVEEDTENYCGSYYDNRCPAGCVAIAIAQIMRYWVHPLLKYDWCNMPRFWDEFNTPEKKHAVAELIKDIGNAVDMDYCSNDKCASSSNINKAKNAFENDFNYSSDIDIKRKSWYSKKKWKEMLREELDKYRPMYYRGVRDNSGHAFICDGYDFDNESFFHFNIGWGGSLDGFYCLFDEDVSSNIPWSDSQKAIFNIKPASESNCDTEWMVYESFRELPWADEIYWNPIAGTIETATPPYNVTIKSGETASYRAFNKIILNDGFTAEAGSNFTAEIIQCPLDCKFEPVYINQTKSLLVHNNDNNHDFNEKVERKSNLVYETELNVMPNPFTDVLIIKHETKNIVSVEVFDMQGKRVYRNSYFEENINLKFLNNGLYLLKIYTSDDIIVTRILKQ